MPKITMTCRLLLVQGLVALSFSAQALEIQSLAAALNARAAQLSLPATALAQLTCGNLLISDGRIKLARLSDVPQEAQPPIVQELSALFGKGWGLREANRALWGQPVDKESFVLYRQFNEGKPGHEEALGYCLHQFSVWKESNQIQLSEEQIPRLMNKIQIEMYSLSPKAAPASPTVK